MSSGGVRQSFGCEKKNTKVCHKILDIFLHLVMIFELMVSL